MAGTDNKSVPEIVVPSKVHVAFGKYENTSYWYVNVSWTPLNGKKLFKPWIMWPWTGFLVFEHCYKVVAYCHISKTGIVLIGYLLIECKHHYITNGSPGSIEA